MTNAVKPVVHACPPEGSNIMLCCGRSPVVGDRITLIQERVTCKPAIPDTLDEVPSVVELGGAVGRRAADACRQGQHDLCVTLVSSGPCHCRCHGVFPLFNGD